MAASGAPELRARAAENPGSCAAAEGSAEPAEKGPSSPGSGAPSSRYRGNPVCSPPPLSATAGLPGPALPSCPAPPACPPAKFLASLSSATFPQAPGAQREIPARGCPVGSPRPPGAEPGGRGELGQRGPVPVLQLFVFFLSFIFFFSD